MQYLRYNDLRYKSTYIWIHLILIPFQENNSFETTLGEDKFSDTSEEVTASDSGKGGSEDDLPTHSHGNYRFQLRPQA